MIVATNFEIEIENIDSILKTAEFKKNRTNTFLI